ncbi:uracil-DNA glycosylase family protein [Fretibacter rubidus]|uniref:uracil-DNA glycosylase family protein n=1 Tax=Fretibacter rubidus TaxID=570162 RepID=UPI00352A3C05
MERALLSALNWWDVSGLDVPEIKPAAPKRKKSAPTHTPAQTPVKGSARQIAARKTAAARPVTPAPAAPSVEPSAAQGIAQKAKTLADLHAAISAFNAGELSDSARQAVFARGNPNADIMVIGEAPGVNEDRAGKPFIGPTGQFLDRIFASIGLTDDDLYITNVINWRPPGDRSPTPEDVALCLPFIQRHIALKKPKLIILVGGVSMGALTTLKGITKTRGQWVDVAAGEHSAPALIVYHPAYLLRRPDLKADMWRDMLSLRAKIADMKNGL